MKAGYARHSGKTVWFGVRFFIGDPDYFRFAVNDSGLYLFPVIFNICLKKAR